ncbi:MAG: glycosyltransferase family 9 protein [Gemmatimonadota bacterium]|nr:glycosyltransferase family 9 protein [Gemmatimonadota bacterium]
MAESWVPTIRKRIMLRVLGLIARAGKPGRAGVDEQGVSRILVIELWNIGDVVLTIPFLAQLRKKFPGARVTLLCRPHAREILAGSGLVDEFIESDLSWTDQTTRRNPFAYNWRELFRIRHELRRGRFDLAFQARRHVREHVLLWLSGARRRVGLALMDENPILTDAIAQPTPNGHKVDDWLALLGPFGGAVKVESPQLAIADSERAWADEFIRARMSSGKLVGIHPGARIPEKRWPLERFREVARTLAARGGVAVLSFSDASGYGRDLGSIPGVVNAEVTLRQMMALMARCSFLLCNDSGPMHIAAALSVPVVAVFGDGISDWFSPLGTGHEIVTPASGVGEISGADRGKGIESVPVSDVLEAVGRIERSIAQ